MMCAVSGCDKPRFVHTTHDFCEVHYQEWVDSYLRRDK